jgi:predicted molibdopterin-dependent oxidoreductase YjgC
MSNVGSKCGAETGSACAALPEINLELFEPFERLVEIEILGRKYQVPEKNSLLRCFQFLFLEPISYGGFCWNGTCRTCEVHYHLGDGRDRVCLACSTRVVEGMVITQVSPEIRFS